MSNGSGKPRNITSRIQEGWLSPSLHWLGCGNSRLWHWQHCSISGNRRLKSVTCTSMADQRRNVPHQEASSAWCTWCASPRWQCSCLLVRCQTEMAKLGWRLCYGISASSLMNRTRDTLCFLREFYIWVRWAASDVSPSSHLAFHLPNTCRVLFVLCWCFGFGVFVALSCFCFLFCKCFRIPNSPRSLDLDDRQGLIASSAMQ